MFPRSVVELRSVVPPPILPTGIASVPDWEAAERHFGVPLPADFRALNEAYGAGTVDNFLHILSPAPIRSTFNLLDYDTEHVTILDGLRSQYPDLACDPDVGRLIPFAWTVNGDELFYLSRRNGRPWEVVVVPSRGTEGERYRTDVVTFLADVLTKRLRCPALVRTFPSDSPTFRHA